MASKKARLTERLHSVGIVESDPELNRVIAEILSFFTQDITCLTDWDDAIHFASTQNPSLFICEVCFGETDLFAFYDQYLKGRPTVFITRYGHNQDLIKQAQQRPPSQLLFKPFDWDSLVESCQNLV